MRYFTEKMVFFCNIYRYINYLARKSPLYKKYLAGGQTAEAKAAVDNFFYCNLLDIHL